MRIYSLPTWAALVAFTIGAASCAPEVKYVDARTQIMLRISTSSSELREDFTALRIALARRLGTKGSSNGERWSQPAKTLVPRAVVEWPVDLPIVPHNRADELSQFEVVVEAVAGDEMIAQARAVTAFDLGARRVLELFLQPCAAQASGFICAEPGCHGESCEVCTPTGECQEVGFTDPNALPGLTSSDDGQASAQPDAGRKDAGASTRTDLRSDAGDMPEDRADASRVMPDKDQDASANPPDDLADASPADASNDAPDARDGFPDSSQDVSDAGSVASVECTAATDCTMPANPCLRAACDGANGRCGTEPKAPGTTCTGGVCDGAGNCGECRDGEQRACGSDTGQCTAGTETCNDGRWGTCVGGTGPSTETCNGQDDDCNGQVDDRASCTNMGVRNRCIDGRCVQCGTGAECAAGQACNADGVCEVLCGNGKKDASEQCDPTAPGYTTFGCTDGCTPRKIFEFCAADGMLGPGDCGEGFLCGTIGGESRPLDYCLPQGPCPAVTGYEWSMFGSICVLPCSNDSQCPLPLTTCMPNPVPGGTPLAWCGR